MAARVNVSSIALVVAVRVETAVVPERSIVSEDVLVCRLAPYAGVAARVKVSSSDLVVVVLEQTDVVHDSTTVSEIVLVS